MKIKTYYSMFGPSEFGNFVKDIKKVISLKEIHILNNTQMILLKEKDSKRRC